MPPPRSQKAAKSTPVLASYALSMETKQQTYGRVALELKQINQDLNYIAVELERIGKDWRRSGEFLACERGAELDRPLAESSMSQAWVLVDQQAALLAERQDRQGQLDRLDA